jgi:hypothetical protein
MSRWQKQQTPEGNYHGELQNGQPHGHGQLIYNQGQVPFGEHFDAPKKYEGEFRNGQPHGVGELTFKNKDVYRGQVQSGVPAGQGQMTFGKNWKGKSLEDLEGMEIFPEKGDTVTGEFDPVGIKEGNISDPVGHSTDVRR